MAILRNVPKTFTFEEQRVEINEIAQDLYDLDLQEQNDVELTDFSVTVNPASGNGNLSYSIVGTFPNEAGSFLFTPPDLSPYWIEDSTKISNWDTAFSWGDHGVEGYLTGIGNLSIGALADVDVTTTAPTLGQRLSWDGSNWIPGDDVGIQWNQLQVIKPNPSPSGSGDVTYNNTNGEFTYTPPELGNFATKASTDDNEPSNPYDGQLWWKSDEGKLKIYYQDVDSSQWVDSSPAGIQLSDLQVQTGNAQTTSALSYNNSTGVFTFNPSTGGGGGGISLTNLSVTSNNAGTAGLTYDNTTGVFSYTPPDLSGYSLTNHTHSYSLHDLSNVNAPSPSQGEVLKWNGTEWAPASDLVGSGTGGIALTDLFIGNPQTPSGNGAIYYDNTSGEFNYTPPVLFSESYNDLTDKPTIPAAQVNSDWNASSGVEEILNKPTIPAAQVNSDWNATTGIAEVLNKPYIAPISNTAPSNGDVLKWNGTEWAPGTDLQGSGGGGSGNVVTGSIIIWSGTISTIPTGWQLCDGTNGSPDLRDKFVVGAGYSEATYESLITGNNFTGQGSFANVFDGDTTTFSLPDNIATFSPTEWTAANSITTLKIYCTKYLNAGANTTLLEVNGTDYTAQVSATGPGWITIPETDLSTITWTKSGNPGDAYGTSDYCLIYAIEVNGTVLVDPTHLYQTGETGGSADAVVVEHSHTTSFDGGGAIPGVGGESFPYGGAGSYAYTTWSMDNAGVDGTGKNIPPYYALCYIYCTSGSSGSGASLTDFSAQNAAASGIGSLAYDNAGTFTYTPPDLSSFSTFSGSYNDLTDKPTIPAAQVQPDWNATSGLGEILNKPTIPGAYNLPTATTTVLGGVKIDGTSITINNGVISSSVGATVSTDDTAPSSPNDGDLWWDSANGRLNVYYQDPNTSQWIDTSGIGSGSTSTFSGSYNDLTDKPTIHTYSLAALLSPGVELQVDGAGVPANRIFFDGGSGVSVVRTNTNPHTIEFKSSFAATLDSKTTSYTLLASDVGKTIKITSPGGGVNLSLYIPNTFTPALSFGDQFTIMNGANESISVDVVDDTVNTLYWSQSGFGGGTGGYSTGDRQIAGFAFPITLTYRGNNEWNIHGDGVF